MYKVIDVYKIADMLSVTLDGNCAMLSNGSKLKDDNNNVYNVVSVAITKHNNPSEISKNTTVLITPCNLEKGTNLFIA